MGQCGETFYLQHGINVSGFRQLLPHLLNRGVIFVGSSAGTIVAGKSSAAVQHSKMKEKPARI